MRTLQPILHAILAGAEAVLSVDALFSGHLLGAASYSAICLAHAVSYIFHQPNTAGNNKDGNGT